MRKTILVSILLFVTACQPMATPAAPTSTVIVKTATPTALPSSTPEPTRTFTPVPPTSLPRFFTEEFDGRLPDWSILQSNQVSLPGTRVEDGMLFFELAVPYQWVYAILGAEEYDDVRVDVLVQSRGTSPEAMGLICRYSEANGWYEFNISGDGTYSVLFGQWLAEGVATYTPIASASSEYLKPGAAQNEIGIFCQKDMLSLHINGKLFRNLDVSRFGLAGGKLGLSIASFDNVPITAAFDWVKVSQP